MSLAGLIIFGFIFLKSDVWNVNWSNAWEIRRISFDGLSFSYLETPALFGAIASALVGAIVSYDAWNNVTFVAGEITNPNRNIGLSLFLGRDGNPYLRFSKYHVYRCHAYDRH